MTNQNSFELAEEVMAVHAKSGFDQALLHLTAIVGDQNIGLEDKLNLESLLAISLLRLNENEDAYKSFYGVFDSYYKTQSLDGFIHEIDFSSISCKRAYFVHNGTLLAHSASLLRHIEITDKQPKETIIFVIQCDQQFLEKASSIGVKVVKLPGSNWIEIISTLKAVCRNVDQLVWVCFPVFLSLLSKYCDNIVWWSMKFHPPINGVAKYVSRFPNSNPSNEYLGKRWVNYRGTTFERWSSGKDEVASVAGKTKFGAFCREDLIDSSDYWRLVKAVLETSSDIYFTYCGRRPIHGYWIEHLDIDAKRVEYLGWLRPVAKYVHNYRFLLDPLSMSHGHLGLEAMASGIPVFTHLKNIFTKSPSGYVASLLADDEVLKRPMTFGQRQISWLDLSFSDQGDLSRKALLLEDECNAAMYSAYAAKLVSNLSLCDATALKLECIGDGQQQN